MKKFIVAVLAVVSLFMTGCNNQIVDTVWRYDEAIVNTGEEIIHISISSWRDYSDSDMVQITATDGTAYYTHGSNVILISNGK